MTAIDHVTDNQPLRHDPSTGERWVSFERWWNGPVVKYGETLSGAADKMCREVKEENRRKAMKGAA